MFGIWPDVFVNITQEEAEEVEGLRRFPARLREGAGAVRREHMGKSRDLSEFERGMIVGARSAGCSISETVSRLGFSKTAVSRVYREWCEKQKTSSDRGSCGRKRLVDELGERQMESVVEANSQATSTEIQALYNRTGEKPISLTTTRRILKRLGYSRRAPRRHREAADGSPARPGQPPPPAELCGGGETELDLCGKSLDPVFQDGDP